MTKSAIDRRFLAWLLFLAGAALLICASQTMPWLSTYPKAWTLPVQSWIRTIAETLVPILGSGAKALSWGLEAVMESLRRLLHWMPWAALLLLVGALGYRGGGWRLAMLSAVAMLYIAVTGYWQQAMNTLALAGLAVPLSVGIGFGLGVLGARSRAANRVIQVILDFMQTVPAFAYLLPMLLLFGFGPVVGLIASAIYAIPPMVRNVILGLSSVPDDVREAGVMGGCTEWQQFWLVEVPSAKRQIMVGVNQTIMAALSMVIIAAVIGGFNDIGWEVLSAINKAQFGQSLFAGLVIALIAMLLDRLSMAFALRASPVRASAPPFRRRAKAVFEVAAVAFLALGAIQAVPALSVYPEAWVFRPAEQVNDLVGHLTATYRENFEAFKMAVMLYVMLPFRAGFWMVATQFGWPFAITPYFQIVCTLLAAGVAALSYRAFGWPAAIAVAIVALTYFFGTTGLPWPVLSGFVALAAWQAGGWRVAAIAAATVAFILLCGLWEVAMLSLYLSGVAVLLCALIGGAIGIWAAYNDRVSAVLRPINDTLQTMPQFVLLIPALMLYQVGDLTALIAIILYAIVPMIRYTEHGLRSVAEDAIDAGHMMGCSPWQLLWSVRLPLAMPQILLGLNQTIMYALAMLVVAALVGTTDLGQEIYIALGKADAGRGIAAGTAMALIAITADRIIQGWVCRRSAAAARQSQA